MRGALFIPKYNFGLVIKIKAQVTPKIGNQKNQAEAVKLLEVIQEVRKL